MRDVSVFCMDTSYGKFKITVGNILSKDGSRPKDFVDVSVGKKSVAEQGMPYTPCSHLNLYNNSKLTDDWRGNKKRGEVSIKPFEEQLFELGYSSLDGYTPKDIGEMVKAANSLLISLRSHPRYKTR